MPDNCPKCEEGLPPWMATFADLMALLMCFFVLLLSFATIDAVRFKKMAESMRDAFGVQQEIPAPDIVKGVSVIKQEWSPSVAERSVVTEIRQETIEDEKENVELQDGQTDQPEEPQPQIEQLEQLEQMEQMLEEKRLEEQRESHERAAVEAAEAVLQKQLAEQVQELQESLEAEVEKGLVSMELKEGQIIVRIQEKGSFGSGSARLDPAFHEVMDRISAVLASKPGKIMVAGHTDNIPISPGRFRSNWELSAARAVTVLHSLLRNKGIAEDRVIVQGLSDTVPLVDNDSPQNRARNRRVELILSRRFDENFDDLTPQQLQ